MTAVQKGKSNENRTHKLLESFGFKVSSVKRPSHANQENDLFGLFDHVAVYTKHRPFCLDEERQLFINFGDSLYIQTKSRKQYGKDLEKYKEIPAPFKVIIWWEESIDPTDKRKKLHVPHWQILPQ